MKFAKTAALIMSLSIAGAALCACNNQPEPVSSDINVIATQSQNDGFTGGSKESEGHVDPNAASTNYKFSYQGVDFVIDAVIDLSKFTEGTDYEAREVQSCAYQGFGMEYNFKGGALQIETYPDGDKEFVTRISIFDDTVSTPEGICVGSTVDQVKTAYGEPTDSTDAALIYEKGGSVIQFLIKNDAVSQIQYLGN